MVCAMPQASHLLALESGKAAYRLPLVPDPNPDPQLIASRKSLGLPATVHVLEVVFVD